MKLNNFFLRALTSVGYVGLIFGSIFVGAECFGLLCAFILVLSIDEYTNLMKRMKISVNGTMLTLICLMCFGLVVMNRIWDVNTKYLIVMPIAIVCILVIEFLKNSKGPVHGVMAAVFGLVYLCLPITALYMMGFYHHNTWITAFQPDVLASFFLLIWANDTGAYLLGSTMGKHKLIERISPKKTVEGSIGGFLLCLFGAWVVSLFAEQIDLLDWFAIAILIVIFGSLGDLFESLLKRKAEVKDSGKIIPGHGGILDRFDSVLFAAPAVISYLGLIAR